MIRVPSTIALGLVVGIAMATIIVFLFRQPPATAVSTPSETIVAGQAAKPPVLRPSGESRLECVLYFKNAPQELRAGHADDECAVQVRKAQQ